MNYKEILIRGSLSRGVNRNSNMVAPQGFNETSFGPELNFTVISRTKFPKKAIVKRKVYDDEEMLSPYVRKS